MDDEQYTFYATHDAHPDGVYLVEVFAGEKFVQHGIFREFEKASEWMKSLPSEYACLCAPFVLNEPEFGNTPSKEQH